MPFTRRPAIALLAGLGALGAVAAVVLLAGQPDARTADPPDTEAAARPAARSDARPAAGPDAPPDPPDDPQPAGVLESLGVPLEEHMTPSTNLWREGNLLYGEAVEGRTKEGPFWVYDLTDRELKYRGNADIHTGFRNVAVDARGNAYFSVNTTGLARYDPRTNAVTVLPVAFPDGFLRASTREASSGWMYLATTKPNKLYRFRPSTGALEQLGDLPGYVAHLVLDPGDRYVYYMPHAHGSAYREGAPVYRFDVRTGEHEVIASINEEIERRHDYRIGGTYAFDIDPEGRHLYLSLNAVNLKRDPRGRHGFGDPVLVVLELPSGARAEAAERSYPGGSSGTPRSSRARFAFADVSAETGIASLLAGDYLHTASWGDVNGDGRQDLFAGTFASRHGSDPARLLLNRGGRFVDSGQSALALTGRAAGSVFADFDNDGDLDLFVSHNAKRRGSGGQTEPSRLLRNDGGTFTDATDGSGIGAQAGNGRQAGVLDYDGDGLLDLFVVADNLVGSGPTVLLRNEGGLRFADVTAAAGISRDVHGLGLAIGDVTGDGWPDVFVAGDADQKRANRNYLFVSNGDGTFRRATTGVLDWTPLMRGNEDWVSGAAMADLNRDGRLDLVVGHHFGSSTDRGIGTRIRVYLNRGTDDAGDPVFEDVTDRAGIPAVVSKQPHVEVQDFDNDGWPDLYASVLVESPDGPAPLVFGHSGNPGDPVFEGPASLSDPRYYAGGPTADYDNDGRVDVFLSEWRTSLGSPATSVLLRNTGASGHWLQVAVEGDPARGENRMGVGAVVTVRDPADGSIVGVREITPATGWSSSQPAIAHFGLGSLERVDLTVRMPFGGRTWSRKGVAVDRRLRLMGGEVTSDDTAGARVPGGGGTAHGIADDPVTADGPGIAGRGADLASSPIVHFAPFPLPEYEGNPWSTWGGAHFASNGKFYAAIGDHLTTDGNSYLYEYDPATKTLVMVGDVLSAVPHVRGEFGHGKIHSRIDEGRDGALYMTTYRGSPRKVEFTDTFRGGVILRYRP